MYQVTVIEGGYDSCRIGRGLDEDTAEIWPVDLDTRYASMVRDVMDTNDRIVGWCPTEDAKIYKVIGWYEGWAELAMTREGDAYVPMKRGEILWRAYG